jgi:chaperonin GroEL
MSELGRARKVIINKDETVMVEGAGKKKDIEARIGQIQAAYDRSTSDYDKEKLQERMPSSAAALPSSTSAAQLKWK